MDQQHDSDSDKAAADPRTERRKLIEVALPLEAISDASAKEKSVRDGHPSALHLWWSRKPLATCRAILFAQLVDDPSCWPDRFTDAAAQAEERQRLFGIIEALVRPAKDDATVLSAARREIARSAARAREHAGRGDAADAAVLDGATLSERKLLDYLAERAPAVLDPFSGGGSIPLEAQRLGLQSFGTDLNPVAVLISKATLELPARFADRPPTTNGSRVAGSWTGTQGLEEDLGYYAEWMRAEAWKRLSQHYPTATVTPEIAKGRPDLKSYQGRALTVVGWLWSRTVASPNPALAGAHVPLATTFWLSKKKKGSKVWVEPRPTGDNGYSFDLRSGEPSDPTAVGQGTRVGRGIYGCVLSGDPIPIEHVRAEGAARRLGVVLKAVVAEGDKERVYLPATPALLASANVRLPDDIPDTPLPAQALGFRTQRYGLTTHADLFTARQLLTLTTLSDLLAEVHAQVLQSELLRNEGAGPGAPLEAGGDGPRAYADAICVYLAFGIDKLADLNNALCTWAPDGQTVNHLFGRQAIPMVWDFVEANPFSSSSGAWSVTMRTLLRAAGKLVIDSRLRPGSVQQGDAMSPETWPEGAVVSTDPPYYDNVPYADLSDFFYVWLRRSLRQFMPGLFQTMLVPKEPELVADPGRRGGRDAANKFFLEGMTRALRNVRDHGHPDYPSVIYYAFRQSEQRGDVATTTGWETFLEALISAGLRLTGTWPVRTEATYRLRAQGSNALASSVALVCRPRPDGAPVTTRAEFQRALREQLPPALVVLQHGNVAPVDVAQASIGPGMAIFSRYMKVVEADGSAMSVREALALINKVLDEFLAEQTGEFDADTRFAVTWFEAHAFAPGLYGEAETLAKARAISVEGVKEAGVIETAAGKVRLLTRKELPADWSPATDTRLTVWECTQHLIKRLESDGEPSAAALLAELRSLGSAARDLAYRLYSICERKKWAEEAQHYNALIIVWPELSRLAPQTQTTNEQTAMF